MWFNSNQKPLQLMSM